MTDYNPSDAELQARASAYVNGPGHPDTFDADLAHLQELAGRVHILLESKFASDGEFSFTFDRYPDASIGRRTGHEFGFSPGFRFWPEDRAGALLVAWRSPESKAA